MLSKTSEGEILGKDGCVKMRRFSFLDVCKLIVTPECHIQVMGLVWTVILWEEALWCLDHSEAVFMSPEIQEGNWESTWHSGASLHVSKLEFWPYPYFTPQIKVGDFSPQLTSDKWIHGWDIWNLSFNSFASHLPLQSSSLLSAPKSYTFKGTVRGSVKSCRSPEKKVQPFSH